MDLQEKVNVFIDKLAFEIKGGWLILVLAPHVADNFGVSMNEARTFVKNWMDTCKEKL